ncbi:MAG: tRNA 2-thiouridine(34) synthase MnmA [Candidatus Gracilibacteria bacterium]|nr:tRNA 2-thiouridine(34) synthase MnmA [Candidatus Gracilibacteria bacterium]
MKKRVLVGLSGGVDSAVSAYLLQKEGYEVVAGFMKNYTSEEENCPTREDRDEAIKVAEFLGIKEFIIFDFREEYNTKVVEYIYEGYKKGITPNPDILCNSEIKFKLFLEHAMKLGFDYIATGHYARIETSANISVKGKTPVLENNTYHLLKGIDPNKDQSYFLAGLNQYQLSKSLFPIGNIEKPEVRKIAEEIGLPNAKRKDSQGICFVGKVDMHKFLEKKIPIKKGNIIDTSGQILGEHNGAYFFTIGQRKGIQIGGGPALFVIRKDVIKNEVTVGTEEELELYSNSLTASNWHWIGEEYSLPISGNAKIRYRQADQEVSLSTVGNAKIIANFTSNQRAIASGQTIALYKGEELIGSGIID